MGCVPNRDNDHYSCNLVEDRIMAGTFINCNFDKAGVETLADDKPSVYRIYDVELHIIYIGVAVAGRVIERQKEHFPGAKDSIVGGVSVELDQYETDAEANAAEKALIEKYKDSPYLQNIQGV